MNNRHLPAGQGMQGTGGPSSVDMPTGPSQGGGGGGGRGGRAPRHYAQQYHHHQQQPMHHYTNYAPPYPTQYYPQMHPHPHYQNGAMQSPAYMPYQAAQAYRSPPAMQHQQQQHQYAPMVGVSVQQGYSSRHSQQQSPVLSNPYQPPPVPAPIPSQTPSSTHSSHAPPAPTSPAVEPPKATEPQPVESQVEPPSPAATPRPPFRAPLPWLSNPDEPFPKSLAKRSKRKQRQPLNGIGSVELPVEQHEGAASQAKAAAADAAATSSPTVAAKPIQASYPPVSPPPQTHPAVATAATPSTPVSTQPTPASNASPASTAATTKSSSRPTVPAIPALPAVPRPGSKDVKVPTSDGAEESKPVAAEAGETKVNGTQSEQTEPPATPESSAAAPAPAPVSQKPKSWASLLSTPASRRAAAAATAASSGASSTVSTGAVAASTDPRNGNAGTFPRAADSLTEALRGYRVGANKAITHIEPRGLTNGGNMCYMNSVLQVLIFCTPFYDFLDHVSKKAVHSFKSQTPLIDAMIDFMREFRVTGSADSVEKLQEVIKGKDRAYGDPLTPNFLYEEMKKSKWFATLEQGHQQDAEEFLGWLLQALDDECSKVMGVEGGANASGSTHGTDTTASSDKGESDDWLEVGHRQKAAITRSSGSTSSSPISKIFGGLLRSEFRVPGLKPSITTEPYQPLQLDIGSAHVRTITDAMKGLTTQEKMHGDFNSSRGKNVEASKQVLIDELPPVLILHLKRFQFDTAGGTRKIAKKVGYPLDLEIPREVLSRQALVGLTNNTLPRYKLFAVVYHHGKNASVGHYTVDVRRQGGEQWIRIDDTKIEPIRAEDVTRDGSDQEAAKESRKEGGATNGGGGSSNRFGAMNGDDGGSDDGWKEVTSAANGGTKKWSNVVNGAGKPGSKSKHAQEGGSERSVAYLLFYQRV